MDFQLTAEQRKIQEVSRRLAADFATRASQHDRETSAPLENYTALQEAGLYSAVVPKEFGGWGSGFLGWVLVAEELAQGCPATALSFNMHAVAVGGLFDHPDTPPAIKQQVASLVVQEQKLLAIAVSETGTSSLMMLATIAPTVQAHRVKGGYQLRGRKTFVSMVEACNYSLNVTIVLVEVALACLAVSPPGRRWCLHSPGPAARGAGLGGPPRHRPRSGDAARCGARCRCCPRIQ